MRGDFAMPVIEEKPADIIAEEPVVKKVVKKASSK
jgi:hypothetical protein